MDGFVPMNDLDKAIAAMQRSPSAMPQFMRALASGELAFLMHYHPEFVDQDFCLKNGSPLPFVVERDARGEIVLLFSSEERAEEGMKKGKVPPNTFLVGSLPSLQVMEILGKNNLRALFNKSCSTGSITIGPDMMLNIWNGKALEPLPLGSGKTETRRMNIIDAADYPTYLVQPLFELMRKHPAFKAAWIFRPGGGSLPPGELPTYCLLTLMQPADEKLHMEFNVIAQAARGNKCKVEMSLMNPQDTAQIAGLFRQAKPYFQAADYKPPQ